MLSDMNKLRRLISSIAVFVAIWAMLACIITIAWWLMPLCAETTMLYARWMISAVLLLWLLKSKHLKIN